MLVNHSTDLNRHGTDPYAWWCGRGGAVRCPSIPIFRFDSFLDSLSSVASMVLPINEIRQIWVQMGHLATDPAKFDARGARD